ncbi:MAG: tail protein X [Alphaproteobacteria bacterium]|nr:tail protein X [Alphaproteobacteria bacterium]
MITYTTKENDVLDWIVWKHYGTTAVLEEVMKANPDITYEKISAGTVINLPYIDTTIKPKKEVRLWN